MARLYSNENFPNPVVTELRQLGHDVLTAAETGRAEQAWPDEAVLDFGRREGRIILTLNRRHFIRLHAERPDHAGIIVCTFDPEVAAQAGRIDEAIKSQPVMAGRLVRVNRPQKA